MADIRSRPSTDTYRRGWDRIFARKRSGPVPCVFCGETVQPEDWTCFTCWPYMRDSHPAAD